jgi:hypothetical protein
MIHSIGGLLPLTIPSPLDYTNTVDHTICVLLPVVKYTFIILPWPIHPMCSALFMRSTPNPHQKCLSLSLPPPPHHQSGNILRPFSHHFSAHPLTLSPCSSTCTRPDLHVLTSKLLSRLTPKVCVCVLDLCVCAGDEQGAKFGRRQTSRVRSQPHRLTTS